MVKLSHSLVLLPYLFSAAVYASPRPVVVARALYFINNEAQNAVIAVKVNPDGTLSDGSVTLTGGAGGAGVNAQGEPAGPDPLFSQGALALSNGVSTREYLFLFCPCLTKYVFAREETRCCECRVQQHNPLQR
jgi:hypothetical protein